MRYSPSSTLIPTHPADLLRWAAAHIDRVGLNRIDAEHYAGPGPTRFKKCSAYGALLVAAGDGRRSSARTYDSAAIRRAADAAYRILAEHITARVVTAPPGYQLPEWHRHLVHHWSMEAGRTQAHVVASMLAAADLADAASASASQPDGASCEGDVQGDASDRRLSTEGDRHADL